MKILHTKSRLAIAIGIALAICFAAALLSYLRPSRASEWTDDAYVVADFTPVAPKAFGLVDKVLVDDNEFVKAGQLLVKIDDRDYRTALASAEADVERAQADIANLDVAIAQQPSRVSEAEAAVRADHAISSFAHANAARYKNLAADGSGTEQESQQALSRASEADAATDKDDAAVNVAKLQLAVLQAERARAVAALRRAVAARDQAKLNLSYTDIRAPFNGYIGRRSVRPGSYATIGSALLAVVPTGQAYIVANYQENQVGRMRLGQPVTIRVDAYPNLRLRGHIDSLAPASDVAFAPIQPDNATGNFTKIVQRIPVKILLEPRQPGAELLRVGMSVITTVDTDVAGGVPLGVARKGS